jgi:hypothetical protein
VERLRDRPDAKVPLAALARAADPDGDPAPLRRLREPILAVLQRPGT